MIKQIEIVKKGRVLLLEGIKSLSNEQLNKIPAGFNNNIIWNLGHMIAVQQGICYKRAGLPVSVSNDFWETFMPGSKPGWIINDAEVTDIKKLFFSTIGQLEADYCGQAFDNYTPWSTRLGGIVANIDDGLKFLTFHEGLHSGIISNIKAATNI